MAVLFPKLLFMNYNLIPLSFEFVFTLFLFAGYYKGAERFSWVPVDLTALFFAMSILYAGNIILRTPLKISKGSALHIALFAIFIVYAVTSLFWSESQAYGSQKAFYLSTLGFWSFLAPYIIVSKHERRIERLFLSLLLLAGWFTVEALIVFFKTPPGGVLIVLGGSYLTLGRMLSIGLIITLVKLLYSEGKWPINAAATTMILVFLGLLLSTGSRAAFLGSSLSMFLLSLLNISFSKQKYLLFKRRLIYVAVMIFCMLGGIVYLLLTGKITATIARFAVLLQEGSDSIRVQLFTSAFEIWLAHPLFGAGIGSWSVLSDLGSKYYYPHNIILELLAELGIVGLFLFVAVLVISVRQLGSWSTIRKDPTRITVLLLFAFALFSAMTGSDLAANRFLLATLGLMNFSTIFRFMPKELAG
jgi:O-antigen ligase